MEWIESYIHFDVDARIVAWLAAAGIVISALLTRF